MCFGNFDWASLAGFNSVPEIIQSGQPQAQTRGMMDYANNNGDLDVPSLPPHVGHVDSKLGHSTVEEEVQSGARAHRVDNSGLFLQNANPSTRNFSNSLDPYGFRYSTQAGSGFGFRQNQSRMQECISNFFLYREEECIFCKYVPFFGAMFCIQIPKM